MNIHSILIIDQFGVAYRDDSIQLMTSQEFYEITIYSRLITNY